MSVSIGRGRFVVGTAVLVLAILLGAMAHAAATAVAFHGTPPKPAFLDEYPVPGSGSSPVSGGPTFGPIADGLDATWVAGGTAAPFQVVKIAAADGVQTGFDIPGSYPAEGITVAGTSVWVMVNERPGGLNPKTAKIYRLDPASPPGTGPTTALTEDNKILRDIATGPDGHVWFLMANANTGAYEVGMIDSATGAPGLTRHPLTTNDAYDLVAGQGADMGLWFLETFPDPLDPVNRITKIARVDLATGAVTPEVDVGPADALVSAPDGLLWFLEGLATGETSITSMTTTGSLGRHGLSTLFGLTDLASGPDGALWFTDALFGNLGRMTPDGSFKLVCTGPGHPAQIVGGPGDKIAFTQTEGLVERAVASAVTGSPCPRPGQSGGGGGGGGGTRRAAKDTTAPKISLSGKARQRFTKKGTITVSVQCSEVCYATGQAAVSTPGASKVLRSKKTSKLLAAGKRVKLTLKFRKKATKAIRRSLRKRKLNAKVTIGTRDAAGNNSTAKRTVKLKR